MLLKKTEGLKVVRKGYHIQKPGSPSGYQSILTNFEAWVITTTWNIVGFKAFKLTLQPNCSLALL